MSKLSARYPKLLEAIRAMGIIPENTKKVVIEICGDGPVNVYTQGYADDGLLGVMKAIDGDMVVMRVSPQVDIDITGGAKNSG